MSDLAGMTDIGPVHAQFTQTGSDPCAEHLFRGNGGDVQDPIVCIRAVEGGAGTADHLYPAEIFQGSGHAVPFRRTEERGAQVATIQQDEHAPVQRRVEPACVQIEIVQTALHEVHTRLTFKKFRQLAGGCTPLQSLPFHHRDGGGCFGDPFLPERSTIDEDLVQRHFFVQHIDVHGRYFIGGDLDRLFRVLVTDR